MKSVKEILNGLKAKKKVLVVGGFALLLLLVSAVLLNPIVFSGRQPGAEGYNQLSLDLPRAVPTPDSAWQKLKFYEKADKDSQRVPRSFDNLNLELTDPPTGNLFFDSSLGGVTSQWNKSFNPEVRNQAGSELFTPKDPTELKVYNKLQELNLALAKSERKDRISQPTKKKILSEPLQATSVSPMSGRDSYTAIEEGSGDPEMRQIDGMLEKILDIQHPDRLKQKLKERSRENNTHVYPVSLNDSSVKVTLLDVPQRNSSIESIWPARTVHDPAFFSLSNPSRETEAQQAINAVIEESQTIVSGATVKIKLLNDVLINGETMRRNQPVYGKSSLAGDRLHIGITSIQNDGNILPVQLSVYDLDGLEGIYVPGSITRDAVKQSSDQAIQGFNMASLDPSIGAQAASAGIQAAKSLIGKKARLVKVSLKSGYRILLKNSDDDK
jgi:conjugative transposon TraM protein